MMWNILIFILILIQFIIAPFQIAFNRLLSLENEIYLNLLYTIPLIVFIIDILKSLNMSFYKDGKLVYDRIENLKRYIT